MAMGSFNRKRQYKQENPMANAGVLARLLGQQSQNIDGVSDAIHAQSQNVGRQQVAELMGTDEFNAATPLEKQAMVNAKTGGRNLGDEGRKSLDNTFKMAGDVQSNEWKQDAAELANQNKITAAALLNTRQNARSDKNNVAAMNRVNVKNGIGATNTLLSPEAIAEKKEQVRQYDEAMKHPDVVNNPALLSNLRRERDTTAGEMIYGSTKKPSAAAVGSVTGVDKNGVFNPDNTVTGKPAKVVSTPKSLSGLTRNSSKLENDLINAGYNQGIIKPVPKEYYQANDPEVKSGKKEKGDAKYSEDAFVQFTDKTGKTHWLRKNRAQIVAYLNKQ